MFLNTVSEAKKLHLSKEDVLKVYDAVKFNDRDCSSLFFGLNSAQFKSLFQFYQLFRFQTYLAYQIPTRKMRCLQTSCSIQWIPHVNDQLRRKVTYENWC